MIVGGAFTVLLVAYGAQYAFGVFFAALLDEFGWRRAELAGAFSLYTLVYCVAAFPAGRLTDRWGPRPVIAASMAVQAASLAAFALVASIPGLYAAALCSAGPTGRCRRCSAR